MSRKSATRDRRWRSPWALGVAAACAITLLAADASAAEPASKVFLNGQPAPVFFNDGDSFRVLSGRHEGLKARLTGYNTLETPGPVHRWGDFHAKELYINAKLATLVARRGVWRCESDLSVDGYGRALWWCPDLAEELIRLGLAHAMTVTTDPADERLLVAQREAIAARRGMWAHGVPDFIMTSLHSAHESTSEGGPRNRLVSTRDGSSMLWHHGDSYEECQEVCDVGYESDYRVGKAIAALRAKDAPFDGFDAYDDERLGRIMRAFAMKKDYAGELVDAAHAEPLHAALEELRLAYLIGRVGPPSCHVYTDFRRRYGGGKAACLKW